MKPVSNLAGRLLLISTLALGPTLPALAFNLDSNEPIRVTADSARLDDTQGTAVYRGNVEVRQGGILLTADRVDVSRNAAGLDRIDATGRPATYYRPATETEGAVDAEALTIHYSASKNLLRFERDAVVKQGGDEFRGAVINYNTDNRVVTGEGLTADGEGSGRVEMIIQPRGNNAGNGNN